MPVHPQFVVDQLYTTCYEKRQTTLLHLALGYQDGMQFYREENFQIIKRLLRCKFSLEATD